MFEYCEQYTIDNLSSFTSRIQMYWNEMSEAVQIHEADVGSDFLRPATWEALWAVKSAIEDDVLRAIVGPTPAEANRESA